MNDEKFRMLLEGYFMGTLNTSELRAFLRQAGKKGSREILLNALEEKIKQSPAQQDQTADEEKLNAFIARLQQEGQEPDGNITIVRKQYWIKRSLRYAAVVSIVLYATIIYLLFKQREEQASKEQETGKAPLVLSSDNRTRLLLQDSTVITLDSQAAGSQLLGRQGIVFIDDSNRLEYRPGAPGRPTTGSHNLSTGYGRQFRVVLADGSRVWLNARSAIRYPVQFLPARREVELSGEGYFEVTGNISQPFLVKTERATITVIGTAFNLRAYRDDSLLVVSTYKGKVTVADTSKRTYIVAGQQLIISPDGNWRLADSASFASAVGWKNNLFDYRKTKLRVIMADLSRWYNVQYQMDSDYDRTFTGKIPRTADLSTVLEVLKESGINFKKDGNKIVFFR